MVLYNSFESETAFKRKRERGERGEREEEEKEGR